MNINFIKHRIGICAALSLFTLSACSGNKVAQLEKSTKDQMGDVRAMQAEHTASINELKAQIRELTGRVEELQHLSAGKTAALEESLQRFGSRVPPPEGVPVDLLSRDEERISGKSGEQADSYRVALLQLRTGEFERATTSFAQFVEQAPDTAFTDNALFWTGVCFDKMAQYDRAILSYNDVLQRFPAEDMVPFALARLADSFVKVGSYNDALLTLDKLIDEFPKHQLVSDARKRKAEISKTRRKK